MEAKKISKYFVHDCLKIFIALPTASKEHGYSYIKVKKKYVNTALPQSKQFLVPSLQLELKSKIVLFEIY